MRRFWGRGALVAGLLLGVATVGSYAAGAHLGVPGAPVAAAASQSQPATTVPNSGSGCAYLLPGGVLRRGGGPGHGPRGPRGPRP
jgi:hypothetical protein